MLRAKREEKERLKMVENSNRSDRRMNGKNKSLGVKETVAGKLRRWAVCFAVQSVLALAVCAQQNGVLREVYTGIPGNAVSDLTSHPSFPSNPTFEEVITTGFEAPTDVLEEYGQRMSAYIIAPANGNYTFWIASDDNSVLYLSTDESPANKQVIASVPGWTGSRQWNNFPEQESAPVPLSAGQRYYIEALMKEGNGGDNLAVRWQLPGGTIEEPIPNSRLEVFGLGPPEITQHPANVSVVEGGSAVFSVQLARSTGATYQWQRNSGNIPGATESTYVRSPVTLSDHNTQYRCVVTNPYGNATSSQATLTVQTDSTRPTIVSATPLGDSEALTVLFSEGVEGTSGTLASNYAINNGVTISSASFAGDNRTILLRTSPMAAGVTYTLTVNNVRDLASTPNTILANSQRNFSFDYTPLDVSVIRGAAETLGPSTRATPLVITEIMYNPPNRTDGREVEFIEIYNSDLTEINISGFRISGEIDYTFPTNTVVPARGFLVVAPVPADIQAVYGIANVAGGFTKRLSNGGGTIRLRNKSGAILLEIEYSNDGPWPVAADNTGHSLVLARPSYGENDYRGWAASDLMWGTPGTAESIGANPHRTVLINEILAHTDDPQLDYIELFNYGSSPVDLTGCTLSDRPDENRFVIASGTIPARGFMVFDQNQLGFALSTLGETVYLKNAAGTRVLDAVRFEAQENGVALGRYPDGAPRLHELTERTPGGANSKARIGDVVINEIMYNPVSGDDNDEFVELHNRSANPVDIGGWRFVDGIDFSFPANTIISGNGYVVVAKNAGRLMTNYPGLNKGNTFGNYDGTLANGGERLALARFGQTTVTNNGVPVVQSMFIIADEVIYNDGGRWSRWADGGGSSLELRDPHSDNGLMANWADSDESTKSEWTLIEHTGVMDHGQGAINELHVMLLGGGECLVDNLEVREASGANLVANSSFDSGLDGWVIQGNHVQSGLSAPGFGGSGQALYVRASSGGDNGANRVETDLTTTMTAGNTGTIRGRARWLRGHPDMLLRVHGNHLEAAGSLPIPRNLGTPGAVNSRYRANNGPAIHDVVHSPVLPAANQAVVVRAQVNDPDSLASLVLRYRVDPSTNFTTVSMTYNGAGFYSATIPGHSSGALVAFHIEGTDGFTPAASTRFPAEAAKEALVRFGDPTPSGNFGVYRLWMTQKNINTWSSREKLSNEALDGTFVHGNQRVIYNAGARYRGSPFIRPGYNTPTGTRCAYVWSLPEDDLFLGADELNLDSLEPGDRDPTALREVTSFWMADQLGLPFSYQRYVHVVLNGVPNSSRGIPIYADTQQPDSAFMRTWFPDDDRGEIFKVDDWFEFNDSVGREFNVNARLQNYTTTGGVKKQARYRWSWEKKFNRTLNDDYTSLFSLVDALNAPDATYVSQVENTLNVDDWITVFALRHAVGDWDGYGYNRGKNTFTYKPFGNKWRMLLWDLDFSLGCNGGHPPTQDLFQVDDPTIARLYNHPHFRRAYLNALHRIAHGPFESANVVPFITARYNAFQANGISTTSPFVNSGAQGIPVPEWISQRRDYIISELSAISAGFAITSNNGNNFNTGENFITLTGTAPIEVKFIEVNGISYPIVWTSTTTWTIQLALGGAANNLMVRGYDYYGQAVAGAQDTITINYTGSVELPQDALVINEIMYNPLTPSSSFIEIFNRSLVNAFDLSNYVLDGADFAFGEGTIIQPGEYLVVANNVTGFIASYGNTIPIAGVMGGNLDNDGETLKLVAPGATPEQDVVIDEVTYDDDAPWPGLAAGFGPSLQLIDPAQDNNRVANWDAIAGGGGGGSQALIGITDSWKYNQSGTDLGTNWKNTSYNDGSWSSGAGLLYVESATLPAPKNTALTLGPSTFYFRKGFSFSGNPATTTLQINTVIDDGAVYYLNGVEVLRMGMPSTTIGYDTFANRVVNNAGYEGPFTISSASLVQGNNVLAVEVHQANAGSSDVVFGMTLDAESNAESPYTPGAVNSTRATLGAIPLVWLNEIQPNNVTGLQDNAGDRDPWVEVYNSSGASVDLSGYYLSDDYGDLTKWAFPAGTTIAAGQFRVVWLDNETGETSGANLHANFRASPANGSVVLTRASGSVTSVVDYLNYNPINNDRSYGAYPDGTPTKRLNFYYATPGAANDISYPGTPVFINEWMAGNASAVVDPADGDFDDWFELYNAGPVDIDLSGFRLTDTAANPTKWTVPFGTTIPAGGHLLIWADEELTQNGPGALHADFKLSLGGEAILLYAPNGELVDSVSFGAQTNDTSQGRWPDGNSELYFMTTYTPGGANTTGASENVAPVLSSIGNKSGNENSLVTFTALAADADSGQSLTFSLDAGAPEGAVINATSGVFTWTPAESDGPGVYSVTVRVTDNGTPALSDFETITVTVNEVNSAPALAPIGDRLADEGMLLTFTALGSDGDIPAQTLSYALDEGAPVGAGINPSTGVFSWVPTEAQGPGEYSVTIIVSDNGAPEMNASETITVTVREVNAAPTLGDITDQSVNEGSALSFSVSGADGDLPAQALSYTLVGAPAGASINSGSGAFTWTPSEAQGPSVHTISVVVTDNGVPARSATKEFTITVNEVNSPPTTTAVTGQTIPEGEPFSIGITALDEDLPAQTLAYSLLNPPAGATINAANGSFSWTPTEAQGPSVNTIAVVITDNGTPALRVTNEFTITVNEVNSAPTTTAVTDQTIPEGEPFSIGITASDNDLPAQTLTYSLLNPPAGATINAANGNFTWTPSEGQGPGEFTINVSIADDVQPPLTITNSFTLTVSEVNSEPVLGALENHSVVAGQSITFTATATDADLPAQILTFALEPGAPTGASIDESTGAFNWTPTVAQAPSTNSITVRLTDNGSPALSVTQSFEIIVRLVAQPEIIPSIAGNEFRGTWNSQAEVTYRVIYRDSIGSGAWQELSEVTATGATSMFTDALPGTGSRFYQIEVLP